MADDVAWIESQLCSHGQLDSATGLDAETYAAIMDMDNDLLAELINACIKHKDAPSVWLTSVIIGILKRGKPADEPDSYRVISLECCLLKMATMIVHKRLADWADSMHLIPDWQNGFRPGYRTLNNAFILRCAIEWAKAKGHPLFVAMVDATNAFPSTDHSTLWLKLVEMGAGGPIFDWLRFLYEKMEYCVRHGDETSEIFKSLMGLLTGDPASTDPMESIHGRSENCQPTLMMLNWQTSSWISLHRRTIYSYSLYRPQVFRQNWMRSQNGAH